MRKLSPILLIVLFGLLFQFSSCKKEEAEDQEYTKYSVRYVLENNLSQAKRFIVTYKNPAYANKTTEQFESIQDTISFSFEAKSLDYLYMSAMVKNDTSDFSITIFVDNMPITQDSASCNWQCEESFAEIQYYLK